LASVGSIAYLNHPHCLGVQAQPCEEPKTYGHFRQYIEQNDLVTPALYKKFQEKYKFNHFFEKGVLKDLEGLDMYDVFINKDYHDGLAKGTAISEEGKSSIHENAKIHCTFSANTKLQCYGGNVHGGFTFTLLDNLSGCLAFMASDFAPAVTAYLNVKHEKPMGIGSEYMAVIEVEKVEGRKVFLKGKIIDKDHNVYSSMESLFIKPKWADTYLKPLYKILGFSNTSQKAPSQQEKPTALKQGITLPWLMCN